MKILRQPKIKPIVCERCSCVYVPSRKDMQMVWGSRNEGKMKCPICGTWEKVEFETCQERNYG